MKTIISKIDFSTVFAACLIARLALSLAISAPRAFEIAAGVYVALILTKLVNLLIHKIVNQAAGRNWKTGAKQSVQIVKPALSTDYQTQPTQ